MIDPFVVWDVWSAGGARPAAIAARQARRLRDLVAYARRHSPVYRDLYGEAGDGEIRLRDLPTVSKAALMPQFDRWVTDPNVTHAMAEGFAADSRRIGELLDGRWAVWRTSGTSGEMGLFLHDRAALDVYDALFAARAWPAIASTPAAAGLAGHGWRMACVLAREDHFAGIASWRHQAHTNPMLAPVMRDFSVMTPIPQLVRQLNAWDPGQLVAYPSVLSLLANEQELGHLGISPGIVVAGGETLETAEKVRIERAFGAAVLNVYACSEADYLAFGCDHGWLHVNDDWMILEPVDRDHRPVAPGTASHTLLLTNLANRTQPVIRYDLHDSVTVKPERCPCGSPFTAIRVEGRRNQTLRFTARDGQEITLLPLAIGTAVERVAGLRQYQVVQTGPDAVTLRYRAQPGADAEAVGCEAVTALAAYLATQGAGDVDVLLSDWPPQSDPRSGKFHSVVPW
jgi:putative adenylate-forming enzyme